MDSERTVDGQVTQMDSRVELVTQLASLRKDLGCTPERLVRHEAVYTALRKRVAEKGTQPTVAGCIAELKKIAETLHDVGMRESLLVSLGLDERFLGQGLTTRRVNYLASQGATAPSERTLRRWEDEALNVVASLLSENQKAKNSPPEFSSKVEGFEARLKTVSQTATYHFSASGSITYVDVVKWVKATDLHTSRSFEISTRYMAESRQGIVKIIPNFGCSLISQSDHGHGTTQAILEVFKQLNPGDDLYSLGYRMVVDSDQRCEPLTWWSVESPIAEQFEIRLIFHEDMIPERAWWYVKANQFAGQIEPDSSAGFHLDLLDNGRYVCKMFETVHPYWTHGISWIWK